MNKSEDDAPEPIRQASGHVETSLHILDTPGTSPGRRITRDMLPELLLKEGHATAQQIRDALKKQHAEGVFFGEILVREGILAKNSLVAFLTSHCRIPYLDLLGYTIDQSVLKLVPADTCWKYHLLPLDKLGRNLTVAMVNPLNKEALSVVSKLVPHLMVRPILCEHKQFELMAERFFGRRDGHDEYTWAYTSMVHPSALESTPQPIPATDHPIEDHQRSTPPYTPGVSGDRDNASVGIQALLDREALIKAIFAGDHHVSAEGETEMSPARCPTASPAKPKETDVKLDRPYTEDRIVSEFNSVDGLVQQIADILFDSMHETYLFIARKMPLFRSLSPGDVALLFSEDMVTLYEEGMTVYGPENPVEGFYLLLSGQIRALEKDGSDRVFSSGHLFGEEVFSGATFRTSTATATVRSSVLKIRLSALKGELSQESAVQLLSNIISMLAGTSCPIPVAPVTDTTNELPEMP